MSARIHELASVDPSARLGDGVRVGPFAVIGADVVVGSRFVSADGLEAFDKLDDVTPSPGERAVGEERAWGRRLAKRFGVDSAYDAKAFVAKNGQSGFLDFESSNPDALDADVVELFGEVDAAKGDAMIVYGWTMAEDLVKLGAR